MPANVRDVLKINIVFVGISLLNDPTEVRAFSEAIGADVALAETGLVLGFPPGPPMTGRKLALQRDRINIDLVPDRTVIEREFPADDDLERLAKIAGQAWEHTRSKGTPRAFGYNLELVYDQTSGHAASDYIGQRLFGEGNFAPEGWTLQGGAGRMFFDSEFGRWTIAVEPRFQDESATRVFLNLNLHKAEQRVPGQDEMLQSFKRIWEEASNFVHRLDGGAQ